MFVGCALVAIVFMGYTRSHSRAAHTTNKQPSFSKNKSEDNPDKSIFYQLGLSQLGMSVQTFNNAMCGFNKLRLQGIVSKSILTIVDLSQPSNQKRLYVIDVAKGLLLKNTLVAHGRNSGDKMATRFSNVLSSLESSLGFYVTENTYTGSNGYSLRLNGLEKGINDNALTRAIVMHGADYVNENVARQTGRIGRSWGCPAVSQKEHRQIIDLIKNGSCLFIAAAEKKYLSKSAMLPPSQTASTTL